MHKIDVMRKCDVIGMTVTGAAMRANLLGDLMLLLMFVYLFVCLPVACPRFPTSLYVLNAISKNCSSRFLLQKVSMKHDA